MDLFFMMSVYLLGSIPSAYLVGRAKSNIDIREQGSGNVGTMNTRLVLGTLPALLVLGMDVGKGAAAVFLARWLGYDVMMAAFLAVAGHIYPVWLKFRGGKGLATAAGSVTAAGLSLVLIPFLSVFLLSYLFLKQVDQASLLGVIAAVIYVLCTGINFFFFLMILVISIRLAFGISKSRHPAEI